MISVVTWPLSNFSNFHKLYFTVEFIGEKFKHYNMEME